MLRHQTANTRRTARRRKLKLESLEPRLVLDAMPIITELMASGGGDFADGYGETPDWVEIYNAGDSSLDLGGWHLTDEPGNLDKWTFPSRNLEPGEFLVVFASGNGVIDPGGNLHTSFRLSGDGEYLALVEPDGATIAAHFEDGFPGQFDGTSYGLAMSSQQAALITSGAAASVLIPSTLNGGDALGDQWKGGFEPFADGGWFAGTTGIGFGAAPSGDPPVNLAPAGTATASSEGFGSVAADANDGSRNGAFASGSVFHTLDPDTVAFYEVDLGSDFYLDRIQIHPRTDTSQRSVENFRIDVFDSGGSNVFSETYQAADSTRDLPWGTSEVRNVLGQRVRITRLDGTPSFMTFAEMEVYGKETPIATNLARAGIATGSNVRADSSFDDAIDGDINGIFGQRDTTGVGDANNPIYHSAINAVGNFWQVDLGAVHDLDYINVFGRTDFQGNASDVTLDVLADDGTTVNFTQNLQLVGSDLNGQRYDLTVDLTNVQGRFVRITSNQGGSNFALALAEVEVFAVPDAGMNPDVQTDVSGVMEDVNSSAFIRVPFRVSDPAASDQLLLKMKYNDGFVAYINGQEVAARNAPPEPAWNSNATGPHSSFAFEEILIPNAAELLQGGAGSNNILAIHGLNTSAANPDFLILPELYSLVVEDSGVQRHFPVPTPGAPSGIAAENRGPAMFSLTEHSGAASDDDDLVITAAVADTASSTAQVRLQYRANFGAETPVTMVDDGTGADAIAGDGLFTAVIPASSSGPGDALRWRAVAEDTEGNLSHWPMFADPSGDAQSEEYFGTMIADPGVTSDLPILYWWPENQAAADTRSGTRAAVFYDGEFYDNVFVRDRGAFTTPGNKFKFGDDHPFLVSGKLGHVTEFNLNANGSDPAHVRQALAFQTYQAAGVPASESFLVLSQRNGVFHRVATWIEQPDEPEFLDRNDLDASGTVYKLVSGTTNPTFAAVNSAMEKKLPADDNDTSDIQAVVDGLNLIAEQDRREFLFDTFDIPALVNFIAARAFTQDLDSTRKNFYMYRDTAGSGEWSFFPWDNDWTFGVVGGGSPIVASADDEIASGNANFEFASHPFIGDATHHLYQVQYSLLHEVVHNVPETREMFLRRLRTLMDESLQPPGTPLAERFFENRVDELFAPAAPHLSGSIANAIEALKDYFERRRVELYQNHSVDNVGGSEPPTLVPEFVSGARYFVPTDNSLGTSWTGLADPANILDWGTGQAGFGYEDTPGDYQDLIRTNVRPVESCATCTSIYVRIPFDVDDLSEVQDLTLRMKYDDGFIAYLNGTQVAKSIILDTPGFDSTPFLGIEHSGVEFQDINISRHIGLLNEGPNVLAIHSFNRSSTDSDQLVSALLINGTLTVKDIAGIPHEQIRSPQIDFADIEYDPASGNQDEEYIQLRNPNDTAVDLTGWRLVGGVEHVFYPGTVIPAGGMLYVSPNVNAFRARATGPAGGQGLFVQGAYAGHLSNLGETIDLLDAEGFQIDTVTTPAVPSDAQRFLRITELHYNPAGSGDDTEFIEIKNISDTTLLDLSGVTISEGPSEPFAFSGSNVTALGPGEVVLVVRDLAAFQTMYPGVSSDMIAGQFAGSLANGGERIKLDDANGSTIVDFTYEDADPWPQRADGTGASLELVDPADTPIEQIGKYYHWRGSTHFGGSPGEAGADPIGVVVNEVLSNTDVPTAGTPPSTRTVDAIELHNLTASPVAISGWFLSDASSDLLKFEIPVADGGGSIMLGPGAYIVFDEHDFNPTPEMPGPDDFALNGAHGDEVFLVIADEAGGVATFVDDVHFGAAANGQTFGRVSNGTGGLAPLSRNTLGCANSHPRVGPLIISEVNYHPDIASAAALSIYPALTRDDLEFVEVHNPTNMAVDLTAWRIRGGVDYDFDDATTIAAGETVVIISFNPDGAGNSERVAAFRSHYHIDADVRLLGGFADRLSDSGERVRLERPDEPPPDEPAFFPYLSEDQVLYDDLGPWDTAADGSGSSLWRSAPVFYGNTAGSWIAAAPSPGRVDFSGNVQGDLTSDRQVTAEDIDVLFDAVNANSGVLFYDFDGNVSVDDADVAHMVEALLSTHFGDANLDGTVDGQDFGIWSTYSFQRCTGWAAADFNGDGSTDGSDFNIWNQHRFLAAQAVEASPPRTPRAPLNAPMLRILPVAIVRLLPRDAFDIMTVQATDDSDSTIPGQQVDGAADQSFFESSRPKSLKRRRYDLPNSSSASGDGNRMVDDVFALRDKTWWAGLRR